MEIMHGGLLIDGNGNKREYEVRKLQLDDLQRVLAVQKKAVSELANQDMLQPLDEEEFRYILEGHGMMIGAFIEGNLIAFRALLAPQVDEEHLGRDIGLEEDLLNKVIYQEISIVLPEYRGNKLQKILAILIMQELSKEEIDYQYVCCTVAPFNIASLKDKFVQGMEIAALKEKYGGMLRYVFIKDLKKQDIPELEKVITIPMEDTAAQQEKLAQGWRGFQIEPINGVWHVYYGA